MIFSFGSIDAVIRASNASGSPLGGHIGRVEALGPIDGLVKASVSVTSVRSGDEINATIIAPQIGPVVEYDASLVANHPYPATPDSIKADVLAAANADHLLVLAARQQVADDIVTLLDEIATARVAAFDGLAQARAEADASIADAVAASQDRLQADIAATKRNQQEEAAAAVRQAALLQDVAQKERVELLGLVARLKTADDAAHQALLASQQKVTAQLATLDGEMLAQRQADSSAAIRRRNQRETEWNRYRLALLGVAEETASYHGTSDPLDFVANSVYGFADMASCNLTKWYRQALGWDFADYNSREYMVGMVAGAVTSIGLAFVNPCNAGRIAGPAMRIIAGVQASGNAVSLVNNLREGNYGWAALDALGVVGNISQMLRVCFAAGTPLLTPDGSKPIEQFQPGDLLLSAPEDDPRVPVQPRRVEEVFTRSSPLIHLRIGGQVIRTTGEHPFYVRDKGWTPAGLLQPGDLLRSHDGQWVPLEAMDPTGEVATVYNLRIEEYHTYFVGSAAWGFSVWAHNAACNLWNDFQKATKGQFPNATAAADVWNAWNKGTFPTKLQSIMYHWTKHGNGRTLAQYTQDAIHFFNQNKNVAQWGTWNPKWAPSWRIKIGNLGGYFDGTGRILTFWS